MLFFFHLWQWVLLCLWVDFSCYSLFPPSSFSLFVLIFVSDIHTFLKSLIVSSCLFVFKSGMPWKQAFFVRFSTRWFGFALFQGWSGPQRRVFQSSDWRIRLPTFWEPGKEERCRSQYSVCSCSPTLPALVLSVSTRGEEGLRVTTESAAGDSGLPSFHPASPSFPLQKYLLLPVPEAAWGGSVLQIWGFCLFACLLFLWPVQGRTFSGLVSYYSFICPPASKIWLLLPSLFFPLSNWGYSFYCHLSGAWGETRGVQTSILTKNKLLYLLHVYISVFRITCWAARCHPKCSSKVMFRSPFYWIN